jgi:hypothetical protein
MENQTNYPPQQPASGSSGANTVLLVIIILILAGFGYWWYTHAHKTAPPADNSVHVDVNVPAENNDTTPPPATN